MKREEIIRTVEAIKNGTINRVQYQSEMPLKAEFKKLGYKIIKITETSARFGVAYDNIKSVIDRKKADEENGIEKKPRVNNYEWVIKNKVKHNNKTNKDYVVLAKLNNHSNSKVKYVVEGTMVGTLTMDGSLSDAYKKMVIESYFKNGGAEVKTISFDNILKIGNKCFE